MNTQTVLNPKEALNRLKEGNRRFINGVRAVEPMLSHLKMRELAANGQKPFAIILTCSDSRSPVEMIFDQGIRDLFVVRVAGNVVAPSLLASIEFAAANFGSSTVVVLGHTKCGAVTAAIKKAQNPKDPLPSANLEELVERIHPAVEKTIYERSADQKDFLDHCIRENVFRSMNLIEEQSEIVRQLKKDGKLSIEGAVLDISTGEVNFID